MLLLLLLCVHLYLPSCCFVCASTTSKRLFPQMLFPFRRMYIDYYRRCLRHIHSNKQQQDNDSTFNERTKPVLSAVFILSFILWQPRSLSPWAVEGEKYMEFHFTWQHSVRWLGWSVVLRNDLDRGNCVSQLLFFFSFLFLFFAWQNWMFLFVYEMKSVSFERCVCFRTMADGMGWHTRDAESVFNYFACAWEGVCARVPRGRTFNLYYIYRFTWTMILGESESGTVKWCQRTGKSGYGATNDFWLIIRSVGRSGEKVLIAISFVSQTFSSIQLADVMKMCVSVFHVRRYVRCVPVSDNSVNISFCQIEWNANSWRTNTDCAVCTVRARVDDVVSVEVDLPLRMLMPNRSNVTYVLYWQTSTKKEKEKTCSIRSEERFIQFPINGFPITFRSHHSELSLEIRFPSFHSARVCVYLLLLCLCGSFAMRTKSVESAKLSEIVVGISISITIQIEIIFSDFICETTRLCSGVNVAHKQLLSIDCYDTPTQCIRVYA